MRDDLDSRRVDACCVDQPAAAVLSVDNDAVSLAPKPRLRAHLAAARLAWDDVVRRHDQRSIMRHQPGIKCLKGRPLKVSDVELGRRPAPRQHVGEVIECP